MIPVMFTASSLGETEGDGSGPGRGRVGMCLPSGRRDAPFHLDIQSPSHFARHSLQDEEPGGRTVGAYLWYGLRSRMPI